MSDVTWRDIRNALSQMTEDELGQKACLRPYMVDGDAPISLMPIIAFGTLRRLDDPEIDIYDTSSRRLADRSTYAIYYDVAGGAIIGTLYDRDPEPKP